jgi:uncharacterized protein YbgA (DUF1722 family)/uncharacterized protein YbbK (DUF523 family)
MIKSDFVRVLKDHVEFVEICPEMDIGLPAPREAIRLVKKNTVDLVGSMSGISHLSDMQSFCDRSLESLNVHGAILKGRSPTCGIKDVKVYGSIGKVPCLDMKMAGIFGGAFIDKYPFVPIEDEGRLRNFDIRHHFLTRIYVMADFDQVKRKKSIHELMAFQSRHKYLLMAYHQVFQKKMGKCLADNAFIDETIRQYEEMLHQALLAPLKPGRSINMMMHIFGYFSQHLSGDEKNLFLKNLEWYRQGKLPFISLMSVLHVWVVRFNIKYLKDQTIFRPYPIEIMDVLDSGKGVIR